MAARNYDVVRPNYEALKMDMVKMGITAKELSNSMDKSDWFITNTFGRDKAERRIIETVETRMFKPHGTYYTEIDEGKEKITKQQKAASGGTDIVLKQILAGVGNLSEKVGTAELVNAIKANGETLQEILQKQKEMTTLAARILSNMERRQG